MTTRTTAFRITAAAFTAVLGLAMIGAPADAASKKPSISKISPTTGPLAGGTKVTITGKNFTKASKVYFGAKKAKVKYASKKKLTATAPKVKSAGAVKIKVKTSRGSSKTKTFTYKAKPSITGVSPAAGTRGSKVTITGKGFVAPTTVSFGGQAYVVATVVSSTRLTVITPRLTADSVKLTATTRYGTSGSRTFTYLAPPVDDDLLTVGSFNVRVASGSQTPQTTYEKPWTTRLPVVAHQIEDVGLDVVGVQEASASGKYTKYGSSQFDDLVKTLGTPYALTNTNEYCKTPDLDGTCPDGASSSDRIIYNDDRLDLLTQGSRKLDTTDWDNGSGRYVVWATFEDTHTHKSFFFASTHLEPGASGTIRQGQATTILNEITAVNTANLPVVLVGDLGSGKFDKETIGGVHNISHQTLIDGGFTDPLVNTYKYKDAVLPTTLLNTNYSSLNYFASAPQQLSGYPIGSYLDYILTRGGSFTYDTWETVVNLGSSGKFAGVIPSDHNLITLSLKLP